MAQLYLLFHQAWNCSEDLFLSIGVIWFTFFFIFDIIEL